MTSGPSFRLKKPPLTASLIALCAAGILCGLGTWQVVRLSEKEALLQTIETEAQKPHTQLSYADFSDKKNIYRYGTLEGRWLPEQSLTLIPRTYEGKAGGHLYTPLALMDGEIVMINRGWIPENYQNAPMPRGSVTVTGEILPLPSPNMFTPDNPSASSDAPNRRLYRLDGPTLKTLLGSHVTIAPLILRADNRLEDENPEGQTPPVTIATQPHINNNHASYALFWYSMALILAVIFVLRFMRDDQ